MPRTSIAERFGRVIKRLREETDLSQDRFAAKAKIDRSYYSRIERGLVTPSIEVVDRLVKALKSTHAAVGAALDAER